MTTRAAADERKGWSAPGSAPAVSVVIPVRNEGRYLRRCLNAVLAQDYPADRLEILVVDGRSTDSTREIVQELAGQGRLRLLDNPVGRIPQALNIGIQAAQGEVIVRVDGHTEIAREYVSECVRALATTGAAVVGGPRRLQGKGFWGEAVALAMASPFSGQGSFHRLLAPSDVESVFLGAYVRTTLDRVGPYDESFRWNEDYELNYRIRRAGGRIYCTPSIQSVYFSRSSLRELAQQFWNYGRGKARVVTRHPGSIEPRHVVAPSLILGLGAGFTLALARRPGPILGLLGLYTAVTTFWACRAAPGRGPGPTLAVAVAFPCMHLSWGAGLLVELLRVMLQARRGRPG